MSTATADKARDKPRTVKLLDSGGATISVARTAKNEVSIVWSCGERFAFTFQNMKRLLDRLDLIRNLGDEHVRYSLAALDSEMHPYQVYFNGATLVITEDTYTGPGYGTAEINYRRLKQAITNAMDDPILSMDEW